MLQIVAFPIFTSPTVRSQTSLLWEEEEPRWRRLARNRSDERDMIEQAQGI